MSHYSDGDIGLRQRNLRDREVDDSITREVKHLPDEDANSVLVLHYPNQQKCKSTRVSCCALPSTAEDENMLDSEKNDVLKTSVLGTGDELSKIIKAGWSVCHFRNLPAWLQDNDYLVFGHRPPLPSFRACFKSIFRLHTETGNIWTHLLGCCAFIVLAIYFLMRPVIETELQEKLVFGTFFAGAIICLGCSFVFHTVSCHSPFIMGIFSKLDYCGITFLIMGSFVPWVYYGFYCQFTPKVIYLSVLSALGLISIMVSLWDKFAESDWRPFRTGVFMAYGLSGIVPAIHYGNVEGWFNYVSLKHLGLLVLMALLYIIGALIYAMRVPERWFPGKCDLWFHSHQIFHVFVIGAALVHYHGVSELAIHRVTIGQCEMPESLLY